MTSLLADDSAALALIDRAEAEFLADQDEQALATLNELRKRKPFSAPAFARAADLMGQHCSLIDALRWLDMALSRCTDQLGTDADTPTLRQQISGFATARRDVRQRIGRPLDDLDRSVDATPAAPRPAEHTGPDLARILMWTRTEIDEARKRWPTLIDDRPATDLMRERERQNRELTADDDLKIVMVMIGADDLADFARRTKTDPLNITTRNALLIQRYDNGEGISWPPERNAACWCGSGSKYKKCCGTPHLPPE